MASSLPPRPGSLPPPKVPPRVAAQTRIHSLELELQAEPGKRRRAALQYEIGAVLEHRLDEGDEAARRYLNAYNLDPTFRPPLLALARMFRARRSFRNVDRILKSATTRARNDTALQANFLTHRGAVLHDHLDDPAQAQALWEEAARVDTAERTALVFLEHRQQLDHRADAAERTLELRAERAGDPRLRAALLRELAQRRFERGEAVAAIALCREAAALAVDRRRSLLALAEFGRESGDDAALLEALDALAQDAHHARPSAEPGEPADGEAPVWSRWAAALRLSGGDADGAARDLAAAVALDPSDVLLRLELLEASARAGRHEQVLEQVAALLNMGPDDRHAALLRFRAAEVAQARGNDEAVRAELRAALAGDPEAAAALAVLEDACLDAGAIDELAGALCARAATRSDDPRGRLLWRAAELRLALGGEVEGAFEAYAEAAAACADPAAVWRSLHGLACLRGEHALAIRAAEALLELDIEADERSALTLDRYRRTARELRDPAAATAMLDAALDDPSCADWAPDCARVHAALALDDERLARAHRQLAINAGDEATHAAHLCAAARALRRAGDVQGAAEVLREALHLTPANAYAVAALEELLLQSGEAGEAVRWLREAAEMEHNARKSELSLLHAGAAAEAASELELAVQSYDAAIDRNPAALSPLWALRRVAERSGEPAARLRALEGLVRRAGPADEAALCALELADAYDSGQAYALAAGQLERAATSRGAAHAAALGLMLCPANPLLDGPRDAALAQLSRSDDALGALCARERIAATVAKDPAGASVLVSQSRWGASLSQWPSPVPIFATHEPLARAEALHALGGLTTDAQASAGLQLHAIRTRRLAGGPSAQDDNLVLALELAERRPNALASAVALDESLGALDDPELRSAALSRRLEHVGPECARGLEAAHARALLAGGRATEATEAARRAIARDPADLEAWELLRRAARVTGDWNAVVDAANKLAAPLTGCEASMLLEEAADVLLGSLEQPREAEEQLRRSLAADPTRPSPFAKLHDLYLRRRNWKGLLGLLQQRLKTVRDPAERAELLHEQAVVLQCTGAREAALAALDELLALQPDHAEGLRTLAEVHTALKQWPRAVEALRSLARVSAGDAQNDALEQAAKLLEDELGDPAGALRELRSITGPMTSIPLFRERLGALAVRAELWGDAAELLAGAAAQRHGQDRADLERRIGEILERRLGDPQAAAQAYRRALAAVPTDLETAARLRRLFGEPSERSALEGAVVDALREALSHDPASVELWRKLQRAADWSGHRTLQRIALGALHALDAADSMERRLLDTLRPTLRPFRYAPGAWQGALGAGVDPHMHAVGVVVSQALAALQPRSAADFGAHRRDRVGRFADSALRDEVAAVIGALGGELHELYLGGRPPHGLTLVSAGSKGQVWVADRELSAPLPAATRLRLAHDAMAAQLGAAELVALPLGAARRALYAHALVVGHPLPASPDAASLSDLVSAHDRGLSRAHRRSLVSALERVTPAASVDTYLQALQVCCLRAGLAFCEELPLALARLLGEDHTPAAVAASRPALELLRFWSSAELTAMREQQEAGT